MSTTTDRCLLFPKEMKEKLKLVDGTKTSLMEEILQSL